MFNVLDFGADPTGVADSAAAINAAIASMASVGNHLGSIYIPPGKYFLKDSIVLDRAVHFKGAGAGSYYGTLLKPDEGITAIRVVRTPGNNGDHVLIECLEIEGPGNTETWPGDTAHGIWALWPVQIQHVRVSYMNGNGLRITNDGSNANFCRVYGLDVLYCHCDGVYIQGGESNAGIFTAVSVTGCKGWGINDDSFLGNLWVGCLTQANKGAYRVGQDASYAMLLGCYSEGSQEPSAIGGQSSQVIGGNHAAGVEGGAFTVLYGNRVGAGGGGFYLNTLPAGKATNDDNAVYFGTGIDHNIVTINNGFTSFVGGGNVGLASRGPLAGGYDWPETSQYAQPFGNWSWLSWVSDQTCLTAIAHVRASFKTGGSYHWNRAIEPTATWMASFYLGGGDNFGGNARRITASPHDLNNLATLHASWQAGDIIFNSVPSTGAPFGWVCSASGTLGTYSEGLTASKSAAEKTLYFSYYDLSAATAVLNIGDRINLGGTDCVIGDINAEKTQIGVSPSAGGGSGRSIAFIPPTFKAIAALENSAGSILMTGDSADGPGAIACRFGNSSPLGNATAKIANFCSDNHSVERMSIMASGKLSFPGGDSTSLPGNATINSVVGKAAIASTTDMCVVTNSVVRPGDIVMITPLDNDSTLTTWKVTVSDGEFTVTGNASAAAAWRFQFLVIRAG
jgi:hypothetical protein